MYHICKYALYIYMYMYVDICRYMYINHIYIYVIMKATCPHGYHRNGFVAIHV